MTPERRIRILIVAGTRPEAIKIAPLVQQAATRPSLAVRTVATGQQAMFDETFAEFGLRADLRLPPIPHHRSPDTMLGRFMAALETVFARERPDLVVVQGDTTSAYAGALAADALGIPIAHIEAGLRSRDFDNPWPEERNRVAIDSLAALLFAPTERAVAELSSEPAVRGTVHVTGNTGIDALFWMRARCPKIDPGLRPLVFLTAHRRESFGAGIEAICTAALRLADRGDVRLICPVHTNPQVKVTVEGRLGRHAAITLVPPLSYANTVALMMAARVILTDSGGIQEEAPALGVPTLVLRSVTERQEGVASGNLRLVGTDPDRIVAETAHLLDDETAHAAMAHLAYPFGAGGAAAKILDRIEQYFSDAAPADRSLRSDPFWIMDGAPKGA